MFWLILAVFVPSLETSVPFATYAQAAAFQRLVCSRRETVEIRDDDPALPYFRSPGESVESAKVELAEERVNGCDT